MNADVIYSRNPWRPYLALPQQWTTTPLLLAMRQPPRKSRRDEKKTALSSSWPMTGKFVACLASKAQPECQPIKTDSAPGVDQHKESVVMPPFDIDAELYKLVHSSDSDIDIVFALLIVLLLRKCC